VGAHLVIAADSWELAGLRRRAGQLVRLQWPLGCCYSATLGDRRFWLVANGPGERLAVEALNVACARESVNGVISTGFCGALDPALRPGDIFVASRVESLEREAGMVPLLPRSRRDHAGGMLLTANRVIGTQAEKRQLRERGGGAVDMETAALGESALERGLPFYSVRAVTDTADENFECDFNQARGTDGRFRMNRILANAMRSPFVRLPELWRLRARSRLAADRLGEFLADCEF